MWCLSWADIVLFENFISIEKERLDMWFISTITIIIIFYCFKAKIL